MREPSLEIDPLDVGEPSSLGSSGRSDSISSIETVPDAENNEKSPQKEKGRSKSHANDGIQLARSHTITAFGGRLRLRDKDDDDPTDWWFASTAIPLIAATFAPMANMLSIAALVVSWRNYIPPDQTPYLQQSTFTQAEPDPHWCYSLNIASLVCGFVGNIFLLCNFTRKIRYIIALPVTIFLFYLASAILIGITAGMNIYTPAGPNQYYSQGFWHAIIAATLYMFNGMILMANMLGYFLGHYPQHFDLNDEQRNLILQTMIFFVWLAGGGAVFSTLEGWTYPDGLYFGVVTLLTIGFGDIYAEDDVGKGLVFPFSVGGTIILGLMVSSIHKFAQELSKDKVVRKHVEAKRVNTLSRVVTAASDPKDSSKFDFNALRASISRPFGGDKIQQDLDAKAKESTARSRTIGFQDARKEDYLDDSSEPAPNQFRFRKSAASKISLRSLTMQPLQRVVSMRLIPNRSQKAILMTSEKDKFDKMRDIQQEARSFKKWYALTMSIISFGLLLCIGALVFFYAEHVTQGLSYFQAIYFCYVSLLTIGYGDLSPKSNAGKAFFVVWALVAVPTMTILVSDLGDTVIGGFKQGVLKYGALAFLGKGKGWGLDWFVRKKDRFQRRLSVVGLTMDRASKLESADGKGRAKAETEYIDPYERVPKTIDELLNENLSEPEMMKRLALAIQRVADDMKSEPNKSYCYEEWVEFTRLIRFTRMDQNMGDDGERMKQMEYDEALDGIIEWDWLDSNSPMSSEQSETAWVMDRLLESLLRIFRKKDIVHEIALANATASPQHKAVNLADKAPSGDQMAIERFEPFRLSLPRDPDIRQRARRRTSIHAPTAEGVNVVEHHDDDAVWSKRGKARLNQHHQHHEHHRHHKTGTAAVQFRHHHPSPPSQHRNSRNNSADKIRRSISRVGGMGMVGNNLSKED